MAVTAFIHHPVCRLHEMGSLHPERPARLEAIEEGLREQGLYELLTILEAPRATDEQITLVHPAAYLDVLRKNVPREGLVALDPDTAMNPHTLEAAYRAVGAMTHAVDQILEGKIQNAFCSVRPPGHHAEPARPMGFCVFNNVAVGAKYALERHGLARVAVLDFDVHHGNGTEAAFRNDPRVLLCSVFQHPYYPGTAFTRENDHMANVPLPAGSGSEEFRRAVTENWLPLLERFRPEFVFLSAGFDAHREDPLAGLDFEDEDYAWITERAREAAAAHAGGRIASTLEGGYNLDVLRRNVPAHIRGLLEA